MPGGPVVGVVDAAVVVEQRLGVHRQDRVGPEGPDLADQLLAQGQVVGERAVRLVEEADALVADDRGGGPLLRLPERRRAPADRSASRRRRRRRSCSRRASPTDPSSIQRGRRGGRPEVGVVGVGDDHHEPRRPPVVGRGLRPAQPPSSAVGRPALTGSPRRPRGRDAEKSVVLDFRLRLRSSPPTGEASLRARRRPATTLSRPARRARRGRLPAPRGPRRRGRRP